MGHIRSLHDSSAEDGSWVMGHIESPDGATRTKFVGTELTGCEVGRRVRLVGQWERHPTHGRQFRADRVESELPTDPEAVVRYIAANVTHCGPARAEALVEALGPDCLDRLMADPDRAEPVFGGKIGQKVADAWRSWAERYRAERATERVAIALMGADMTYRRAQAVIEHFGDPDRAERVVRTDPYRLTEVRGIGFRTADAIARASGVSRTDPGRISAGLVHALEEGMAEGHSGLEREQLVRDARSALEVDTDGPVRAALERALGEGVLVEDDGLLYLPGVLRTEQVSAERILALREASGRSLDTHETARLEAMLAEAGLAEAQAEAVRMGMTEGVAALCGRPGSGKTTTTRTLIHCLEALGEEVRVAAPTGKAASRAEEVTGHPASTIHRMIGGMPGQTADEPVDCDVLVLDEASMVSLRVGTWLLRNLEVGRTRLFMVGDTNQLPPVGHGQWFRDLLASGTVPTVELTEIFRQADRSRIVENAHRLLDDLPLVLDNEPESDFWFADVTDDATGPDGFPVFDDPDRPRREQRAARQRLTRAIAYLVREEGVRPATELQVLSPMRRGQLGVNALNEHLQEVLNPEGEPGPTIGGGARVRVGDRVIQTRNDYSVEGGLFNGEQGVVVSQQDRRALRVRFDDRELTLTGAQLGRLQLAWAITVHRSQGSEFRVVVLLYHTAHHVMLDRSLLYTAITRASDRLILIANRRALDLTRRYGARRSERSTRLDRRLRRAARSP